MTQQAQAQAQAQAEAEALKQKLRQGADALTQIKAADEIDRLQDRVQELEARLNPISAEKIIEWVESDEHNVIQNDWQSHIAFVRAIERAHGIGEETK